MTVSSVFGLIYGIIKAVPIVNGWVQQFFEYFTNQKLKEIEDYHSSRTAKVTLLLSQLKQAKTHEEKRVIMSLLADTDKL